MSGLQDRIDEARRRTRELEPDDSRRVTADYQLGEAESLHRDAERALEAAERAIAGTDRPAIVIREPRP